MYLHSSVIEHLGSFQFLAFQNNIAMGVGVKVKKKVSLKKVYEVQIS